MQQITTQQITITRRSRLGWADWTTNGQPEQPTYTGTYRTVVVARLMHATSKAEKHRGGRWFLRRDKRWLPITSGINRLAWAASEIVTVEVPNARH